MNKVTLVFLFQIQKPSMWYYNRMLFLLEHCTPRSSEVSPTSSQHNIQHTSSDLQYGSQNIEILSEMSESKPTVSECDEVSNRTCMYNIDKLVVHCVLNYFRGFKIALLLMKKAISQKYRLFRMMR